jgi:hypothetical protein
MSMLKDVHIRNDAIFYADALNARGELIDFLNSRKLDWIFAIKTTTATKPELPVLAITLKNTVMMENTFIMSLTRRKAHALRRESMIFFHRILLNLVSLAVCIQTQELSSE